MARIKVNEEYEVKGRLTVKRFISDNGEIIIAGTLATHYYFEEIDCLETFRYKVTGIEVMEEVFGSDDFDIVYNFNAKAIDNIFGPSDLETEEIIKIEDQLYGNYGYLKGTVLEEGGK